MKRLIILLMLSLNCSTTAYAQDAKIRVFIEATANDTVGQQLVYELRETLNRSAHLTEAQSGDLSLFQIKIVTLDPSADGSSLQSSTVYSMVLTGSMLNGSKGKIFMDHWVGICGGNMAAKCATQLIASADSDMTPAAQAIKEILRKKS